MKLNNYWCDKICCCGSQIVTKIRSRKWWEALKTTNLVHIFTILRWFGKVMDNSFDCSFSKFLQIQFFFNFSLTISPASLVLHTRVKLHQNKNLGIICFLAMVSIIILAHLVWRQEVEICWRVGDDVSFIWRLGRARLVTKPVKQEITWKLLDLMRCWTSFKKWTIWKMICMWESWTLWVNY